MNIEGAKGISFTKRFEYLGDNAFIKTILDISVECESIGQNIQQVHSKIDGLSNSNIPNKGGPFREEITINGQSFGNGYVKSIVANPEGTDAQHKAYTVNIIIEESGNLDKAIQGIDKTSLIDVDSISENYTLSKNKKINEYSHEVEIRGNFGKNLNKMKGLAETVISNINNISSLLNAIELNVGQGIKKFKEVENDSVAGVYRVSSQWMTYDENTRNSDPLVLMNFQNRFEFLENGYANVTLTVEAIGNSEGNISERFEKAKSAVEGLISSLGDQASEIFEACIELTKLDGNRSDLKKSPISKTATGQKNEAKYTAVLVFTNNLEVDDVNECIFEYSNSEVKEGVLTIVSEEGTVSGLLKDQPNTYVDNIIERTPKYDVAKTAFDSIKGQIKDRCTSFSEVGGDDFKIIRKSETHGYNAGTIKYSYSYSNDKNLLYNDENDNSTIIRRKSEQVSISPFNKDLKVFSVFTPLGEDKYQILQDQDNSVFITKSYTNTYNILSTAKISDIFQEISSNLGGGSLQNGLLQNMNIRYSSSERQLTTTKTILELKV